MKNEWYSVTLSVCKRQRIRKKKKMRKEKNSSHAENLES